MIKKILLFIVTFCATGIVSAQTSTSTEEYQLLSGLVGIDAVNISNGNFSSFINTIYRMSIGLGAALAVIIITIEGIRYAMSDAFGVKQELKDRMVKALGGLLLLMGAFIFLQYINPDLTNLTNKGTGLSNVEAEQFLIVGVGELADESGIDTGDITDGLGTYVPPTTGGSGAGYVWVFESTGLEGQIFDSPGSCEQAAAAFGGESCVQAVNPTAVYEQGNVPVITNQMIQMTASDPRINDTIPFNPFRTYQDFADNRDSSLSISRTAIEMDAYIQTQFNNRFGRTLRLVSGYRNPVYNIGSALNHPHGYSLDYGTRELSQEQLVFLQDLMLITDAKRIGFGAVNNAGTHIQWDYTRGNIASGGRIYWCYNGTPGPFKGRNSMNGFTKGGSCSY